MNKFYDNNANNIEYFDIHNHKPKIEVKKKREDIREFSDSQLAEKLDDVEIKLQGLSEMYKATDNQETLTTISKLTSFKTAIRIEMRNRKMESYQKLKEKNAELESLLNGGAKIEVDAELTKKLAHSESVNENLKQEIRALKHQITKDDSILTKDDLKKNPKAKPYVDILKDQVSTQRMALAAANEKTKSLNAEITHLKCVISENKEAEKTKRHELNVKHDKYVVAYLLEYIKNTVSESEYQEVIEDMNEIREKNK